MARRRLQQIDHAGVPRVLADYQGLRRQHVLRAARSCFSRLGFRATAMHDLLREADMSAVALYCYFRGKHDIVATLIDEVLAEIVARLEDLASRESPPSALEIARLAVQVWAESLYDPRLGTRVAKGYHDLRDALVRLLAGSAARPGQELGSLPVAALAQALTSVGPAYFLQRALLGDADATSFRAALGALLADHDHRDPDGGPIQARRIRRA